MHTKVWTGVLLIVAGGATFQVKLSVTRSDDSIPTVTTAIGSPDKSPAPSFQLPPSPVPDTTNKLPSPPLSRFTPSSVPDTTNKLPSPPLSRFTPSSVPDTTNSSDTNSVGSTNLSPGALQFQEQIKRAMEETAEAPKPEEKNWIQKMLDLDFSDFPKIVGVTIGGVGGLLLLSSQEFVKEWVKKTTQKPAKSATTDNAK